MKTINPILPVALTLALAAASCAEDYNETIAVPETPYEAAMAEQLSQYGVLGDYMPSADFKMATSVAAGDYVAKGLKYSIIKSNFNQIDAQGQFMPIAMMSDGVYDFGAMKDLTEAAVKDGMPLAGIFLCSPVNFPDDYLKSLVADVVIPYEPWYETVMGEDFENVAVGTQYPSIKKAASASGVTVTEDPEQGKVLTCTKLTTDQSMIANFTLPAGCKLGDVTRLFCKCKITSGTATSSRLYIDGSALLESKNDYKTKGEWLDYVFDLSKLKFTDAQLAKTSFNLAVGAYGANIACSVDDIQLEIFHANGDDTVISKTPEEKVEMIQAEMDKWIDGVLAATPGIGEYVIYNEPLDDEMMTYDWAAFLGNDYVNKVQARVDAAVETPVKYWVSQTMTLGEFMADDIAATVKAIDALKARGIRVDGLNIALSATYNEDYAAQLRNDAMVETAMSALATVNMPVRISDFKVKVTGTDGTAVAPSRLNTVERQAIGQYYQKVIAAYIKYAGENAAGFGLATPVDNESYVAPWLANGNRNYIYEGIVNGLKK